ncbi:PssE/Cps14G family polysaccharide biosynthesis glycosyltransferase [Colwellia sp. MEBiC06753]
MKVFVTVGNTHYNSLIKAVDNCFLEERFQVTVQLADGSYKPKNHHYIDYTNNIADEFEKADVVITHAGAGTIFDLLNRNVKVVVVPNFERIDSHQKDLASFVQRNQYAQVCNDLTQLEENVKTALASNFLPYEYQAFNGYDLIAEVLCLVPKKEEVVAGIPVNLFGSIQEAVDFILEDDGTPHFGSAIAINPEKIIYSIKDEQVRSVLMNASIRFADGIGVVSTLRRKTGQKISRIPGCELWESVMEKAGSTNAKVFLVGAKEEVISQTKSKLETQYGVTVCGYQNGYFDDEALLIDDIVKLQPHVITVALGSPRQEKFIAKCREKWPNAFYMGVGGTYDVYTNNVKRAPAFYRNLNLEWFYRLISQPTRVMRQRNLLTYLWLEFGRRL